MPACKVHWHQGSSKPEAWKNDPFISKWNSGVLFIGDKGRIAIAHDGFPKLLPEETFVGFKAPDPFLPESPGHHRQWIEAAKGRGKTGSNFDYAGPFTEVVLLGNVAIRSGQRIQWNAAKLTTGDAATDALLGKSYPTGWRV
jgi:hypothetical protein